MILRAHANATEPSGRWSAAFAFGLALANGCASPAAPVAASAPATVLSADAGPATQPTRDAAEVQSAFLERDRRVTTGHVASAREKLLPLKGIAVDYARYINAVHTRIHPEFADKTLAELATKRVTDPLNDPKLVTRVELVIVGSSGALSELKVIVPSGNPAFDALALASVERAAPFAAAPASIHSADGNVYIHWELARDELSSCSGMHVRPFVIGP